MQDETINFVSARPKPRASAYSSVRVTESRRRQDTEERHYQSAHADASAASVCPTADGRAEFSGRGNHQLDTSDIDRPAIGAAT
ncbi:hypothetical protein EVAR_85370_1 [Eumeta japonica]|uniref:Uncharacterized protein n=1 Tax=Eumeta variegata TaxID=151549 RepID=A0A4C1WVC9_EUMVA|nr:hypothetical protein EVAR_85370_1 [Eumeta japonica]